MLQEKKSNTNLGVGLGIALQIIGRVLPYALGVVGAYIGLVLVLVGLGFFVWGCMNYAEGKGYDKWLGLLGLLSCIGLIVLVVLPDKNK